MGNNALEQVAAELDDSYGWQEMPDGRIAVWRYYRQRLLRPATYWEPEEYTEEASDVLYLTLKDRVISVHTEEGNLVDSFLAYGEEEEGNECEDDSDRAAMLGEILDPRIPYRDLQEEYDEACAEYYID